MARLTACCCCPCLTDGEMPNISIAGYTGQGWDGGEPEFPGTYDYCCYVQEFLPTTTPDWTKTCSDPTIEMVYNQVRTGENIALADEKMKVFEGCFPNATYPCPLPLQYCCDGWTSALINRVRGELTFTRGQKMKLWYRIKRIQVFMFRAKVACPDAEELCKIGMIVKKEWEYRYSIIDYTVRNEKQEITEVGDCFKLNPTGDADPADAYFYCSSDCEFDVTTTSGPDCDSDPLNDPVKDSGVEWLSAMKLFDEMPTEDQIFNSSDLGTELCIGGICYSDELGWFGTAVGDSFYSSVCIQSPTSFNKCWTTAVLESNGTSTTGGATPYCGCDPGDTNPFPPNLVVVCCDEPQTSISGKCCQSEEGLCNEFTCDQGFDAVAPDCGINWDGDFDQIEFCGGDWIGGIVSGSCGGSFAFPLGTCVVPKTYDESPGCYYEIPCDTKIFTYNGASVGSQLTNTLTITSTGNVSRQVCLSFGSVTVVINDE